MNALSSQHCNSSLLFKSSPLSLSLAVALAMGAMTSAQAEEGTEVFESLGETSQAYSANEKQALRRSKRELFFECQQVKTDAARLACYDKVAGDGEIPTFATVKKPLDLAKTFQSTISGNPQVVLAENVVPLDADTVEEADEVLLVDSQAADNVQLNGVAKSDQEILAEVGVTQSEIEKYTPLSLAYDLDKNSERGTWTARPHRPMYLLPLYFNAKPNRSPDTSTREEEVYSPNEMRVPELKLQISVKTKVAEDLFDSSADLWFGYTQQSHWQVYNEDNSRPFRATDYEPEIFLTQPVAADLPFGGRLRMLGAGAVHHSNGQSDNLSRSWNRAYLMAGAEWGRLSVVPRLWARVTADGKEELDDNPDITDFMGYGDVTFLYDFENKKTLGGTIRYNPETNKGALKLDYIHPLSNNMNGYIQIFQGYGESIIDYNHENTGIGFGVVLNDWKGL